MAEVDFKQMSVLIIDDEPMSRELLLTMLQEIGVGDVRRARDAQHGLDTLRQFNPDFIICDIHMEPMDGIEFTRKVRTDTLSPNPYVTIVLLTGDTRVEVVREARDAGANGFLAKPISVDMLRKRLEMTLTEGRDFIRSDAYTGPDRRRRDLPLKGRRDRRRT